MIKLKTVLSAFAFRTTRGRRGGLLLYSGLVTLALFGLAALIASRANELEPVLDVLQLAFTEEMFSYKGEFFEYENVSIRPRPLDASTVLDAWGSWTSEASLQNMGHRGLHPLTSSNATLESYLKDLVVLDEVREANGYGLAERPIIQIPLYCAESEAEAREGAEQYFREWVTSILNMYEIGTDRFANAKQTVSQIVNAEQPSGETVLAGIVEECKEIFTKKKNDKMCFLKIADLTGSIDCVVFPKTYEELKKLCQVDKLVMVKGTVSDRNGERSLLVDKLKELV